MDVLYLPWILRQVLCAFAKFRKFIPLDLRWCNTKCWKPSRKSCLPFKISTELSTIGLLQNVLKFFLLVHSSLFNISGKLKTTCFGLNDEATLVQYPVDMLVLIQEKLPELAWDCIYRHWIIWSYVTWKKLCFFPFSRSIWK